MLKNIEEQKTKTKAILGKIIDEYYDNSFLLPANNSQYIKKNSKINGKRVERVSNICQNLLRWKRNYDKMILQWVKEGSGRR